MKKLIFAVLAVAMALSISQKVSASPISGSVAIVAIDDFGFNSKGINFDGGGLAIAEGWGGSLSNVAGLVDLNSFSFSNADGVTLFNVVSGTQLSFKIEGNIEEQIVNGILSINGTGLMTESGYRPTIYTFNLSGSQAAGSSALEITADAPEPASLFLMGTGLMMLAFAVSRKSKSSSSMLAHK